MIDTAAFATVPVLTHVSREALEALARRAYPISVGQGRRVVPLVDPPRRLVFIREGLAALTGVSVDGKERIAYLYHPGDVVGSRFLVETPESAYEVVALAKVEGTGVRVEDLEAVGRRHPEILFALTRSFARRVDRMCDRLLTATTLDVPVRLAELLIDLADDGGGAWRPMAHGLPHRVLAEVVGASRPHVSAVLGDLEERGAVRRKGRALEVSPARLGKIVRDAARVGAA